MTSIVLIVKGASDELAIAAAEKHNFSVTEVVSRSKVNETITLRVEGVSDRAGAWFAEDREPPFPSGALLWYGYESAGRRAK
jgi:hypothetical protein